jgi:hypothetical protein
MFRPFQVIAIIAVCLPGLDGSAAAQDPAPRARFGIPLPAPTPLDGGEITGAAEAHGTREPGSASNEAGRSPDEGRSEKSEDRIETDRDSFTPATKLAGQGRFILETAYSFLDNRAKPETHSFPEMLVRFGLLKRLELRVGWNYEVGGGGDVSGSQADQPAEGPRLLPGAPDYLRRQSGTDHAGSLGA